MTTNKFIATALLSILFIGMVSCNGGKKSEAETEEVECLPEDIVEMRADQIKLANIETGLIENRSMSGTIKVSGVVNVSPQDMATVSKPIGGFVKSITITSGSMVKKGQTLAILQNQDFVDIQQNYLEAKSKFEYAAAEYKRHNELFKDDVYSEKSMQEVTADYKGLKAQVKGLEQKLALIGINPASLNEDNISSSVAVVSPISGYVQAVNINIGKFVSPSDVLFEIVNSDKLLLELTLFEKDADKASIGQKIRFFINNETDQHQAVIYQTNKSINNDKTYKVYARVSTVCPNIFPGMYVNALIESNSKQASALPSEAIVNFDDKDYIFVFDKNKQENGKAFTEYRMIQVQKGITDNGYTEVILPNNFNIKTTRVVIKGAYNLLSAKKNAGEMSC